MPVIPEESPSDLDAMDEFINWDLSAADASMGGADEGLGVMKAGDALPPVLPDQALDTGHLLVSPRIDEREALMFENTDVDDWSFWALEHYEQNNGLLPGSIHATGVVSPRMDAITAAAASATVTAVDLTSFGGGDDIDGSGGGFSLPQDHREEHPEPYTVGGLLGVPNEPCAHCKQGGYQCKTIQEGSYKGYCTSCVALRCECSFGLASGGPLPTAISFPPNPWPTLGDHPDPIPHDEDATDGVGRLAFAPNVGGASVVPVDDLLPDLVGRGASPKPPFAAPQPKLGARFSRESVRILKNWVSTHSRHPYPTEDEKEALQRLTGLNKVQISNWLANARRRGKIPTTRSTSPHVRSSYAAAGSGPGGPGAPAAGAIDIPQPRRSGTPSPFDRRPQQPHYENILLQRWADSPPENEPASVTDIARAITSSSSAVSSGLNSPFSYNFTDDGSGRSLFNGSSASSVGTSQSSGTNSFASAFSHASRGSFGSTFSSLGRGRRRRRRRRSAAHSGIGIGDAGAGAGAGTLEQEAGAVDALKRSGGGDARGRMGPTPLVAPWKTYQCTFCTEAFKTKHDWQRHEKSLHLSLERWVCAPHGAVAVHPDTKQPCCVFCNTPDPDAAHIESHNFSACQERSLGDRTFYRKDHLRQHLKLVHDVKFVHWSMDQWKVATPEIRSRCGFCGIVMDTWTFRIDHLADHFKTGRTMADWKGDWGFDKPVLDMVENSIPPYLIQFERNSPLPFSATSRSPGSPRNAFELLQGELSYWLQNQHEKQETCSESQILVEACRIVFAAEVAALNKSASSPSWLRDLLFTNEACAQQARLSPIRTQAESRMAAMRINGKETIFDACPLEAGLHEFVHSRAQLGLTAMDTELQATACRLVRQAQTRMQNDLGNSAGNRAKLENDVLDFLLRQIRGSTAWLAPFRQRAHLPRSDAIADEARRPLDDPNNIDATIHNHSRLEAELADFVRARWDAGQPAPDDAALQRQARLIIYELDDGWNQTAADDPEWLASFKSRHMAASPNGSRNGSGSGSGSGSGNGNGSNSHSNGSDDNSHSPGFLRPSPFFLNDTNCYRRLARELTRFVTATMSPNNPTSHVPTDEELQHQARWILYDDDDPWNQTAADNAEWLIRFKRDAGILSADTGPGLPMNNAAWSVSQGGSGFAPPYCFPKTPLEPFALPTDAGALGHGGGTGTSTDTDIGNGIGNGNGNGTGDKTSKIAALQLDDGDEQCGIPYDLPPDTANKYLQSFTTRYEKPATVFCSRELESGLTAFVRAAVLEDGAPFPDDDTLRAKAREILDVGRADRTSADDGVLLNKFKDMVRAQLAGEAQQAQQAQQAQPAATGEEASKGVDAGGGVDLDMDMLHADLNLDVVTQEDVDNLFQDMNFAF